MNTRIIKIIISLGLFMALTGIAVNAQDTKLTANIPFDFGFGKLTMPAGEYDVTELNQVKGLFRVRDRDGENYGAGFAMRVERLKAPAETVLVFNRYRENGGEVSHFLSQVWIEGMYSGYEFFKHRAEREAIKRAAKRDIITIVVTRSNRSAE